VDLLGHAVLRLDPLPDGRGRCAERGVGVWDGASLVVTFLTSNGLKATASIGRRWGGEAVYGFLSFSASLRRDRDCRARREAESRRVASEASSAWAVAGGSPSTALARRAASWTALVLSVTPVVGVG
jgi:hypothetical protein